LYLKMILLFRVLDCNFYASCTEVQRRTAEYPPALRAD
jgi:hypothetical protein